SFFLSSRRRHTRFSRDWSSDVCSSDLADLYLNFIKETGFAHDDNMVFNMIDSCTLLGQEFFNPPEVEGWQRDRQWINTNFIIGRSEERRVGKECRSSGSW